MAAGGIRIRYVHYSGSAVNRGRKGNNRDDRSPEIFPERDCDAGLSRDCPGTFEGGVNESFEMRNSK